MRSLIDMAADRGAFIDQSQSLNLFIENPNIGQLSSMYFYAWKKGLKTTYYLRSRPATRIAKATVEAPDTPRPLPRRPARQRRMDAATAGRDGHLGRRVLAREPRDVRGMPVSALNRACAPPRPGALPHAPPDGLPALLRDVPGGDQEYVDGRGDRLRHRRRRSPEEDDATPSATSFSGSSRSSPRGTRSSRTTSSSTSTSTSTRPRRGCTCRASSTRRRCTSSSISRSSTRTFRTRENAIARSPPSRTSHRSGRRRSFACAGSIRSRGSTRLETSSDRRRFLLNLICFAACIEGLFFFGAFAYVYFLRSRGLLHGLAAGTNWVFRDESAHMAFAFEVVNTVRARGARVSSTMS